MGSCQSSFCQCVEEDSVHNCAFDPPRKSVKGGTKPVKMNDRNETRDKVKLDLLSPTVTEATAPVMELCSPSDGLFSLTSVISTMATTTVPDLPQQTTQNTRFHFTMPSQLNEETTDSNIMEEEDPDAPSDEEELLAIHDIPLKADEKIRPCVSDYVSPKSIIMHPPLVVPPPKQPEVLLEVNTNKSRSSVNEHMLRQFNKMKQKVSLTQRKEKWSKKAAKINDRRKDIKGYRDLWTDYLEMQKLHNDTTKEKKKGGHTKQSTNETNQQVSNAKTTATNNTQDGTKRSIRKSQSFDLQDTQSWFVNFETEMNFQRNKECDDERSCQSGLSLLSEADMKAQKKLYEEKRRAREARYAARMKLETNNLKLDAPSKRTEQVAAKEPTEYYDHQSYRENPMEQNGSDAIDPNTPQLSLPDFEVKTRSDHGLTFKELDGEFMRSMEIGFNMDEKKKDDTSGITEADFETDFILRRRRREIPPQLNDNNTSLASSLISYGKLPTSSGPSVEHQVLASGKFGKPKNKKNMSKGATTMASTNTSGCLLEHDSLGMRIAHLEKKMGISSPANTDNNTLQRSFCSNNETLEVLSNATNGDDFDKQFDSVSPMVDFQSPTAKDKLADPVGDLEPTKLELMFDQTSETPAALHRTSDVREKIVIGNASKCHKQIQRTAITAEQTLQQKSSDDHAMVQVSKSSTQKGSFVIEEVTTENDSVFHEIHSSPQNLRNASFAHDIANEINNVLFRYRNERVVDSDAILWSDAEITDDTFLDAQGKLYSA